MLGKRLEGKEIKIRSNNRVSKELRGRGCFKCFLLLNRSYLVVCIVYRLYIGVFS